VNEQNHLGIKSFTFSRNPDNSEGGTYPAAEKVPRKQRLWAPTPAFLFGAKVASKGKQE
jgi:hypothetical protein